jgi:hypothetical protein
MAQVRSARGEVVNFELIAIKQQLAAAPVPVSVDERRRFIDEKDGVRTKQPVENVDALAVGLAAANTSASAKK